MLKFLLLLILEIKVVSALFLGNIKMMKEVCMSEDNKREETDVLANDKTEVSKEEIGYEALTMENLQTELEKMKDQWLRAVAETENIRRRNIKEREEAQKFAITNFARDMLSVGDNLQRALDNCPSMDGLSETTKAFIEGVQMTQAELLSILERQGIKKINPLHEKFDPNFHQAMFEIETADYQAGVVLQVLQHGFVLHERLLRPALVGVSKSMPAVNPKVDTTV